MCCQGNVFVSVGIFSSVCGSLFVAGQGSVSEAGGQPSILQPHQPARGPDRHPGRIRGAAQRQGVLDGRVSSAPSQCVRKITLKPVTVGHNNHCGYS